MKKFFIAGVSLFLVLTLIVGVSVSVSAASGAEGEVGEYDYDRGVYSVNGHPQSKKGIMARVTEYVGGGRWQHWITVTQNYSGYEHGKRTHSATVKNRHHSVKDKQPRGIKAEALCYNSLWGNKSYWNTY